MTAPRDEVYAAFDSEREYQDARWGDTLSGGRSGDGSRTVDEFALYISGYTNDLIEHASHFGPSIDKLNIIRKIGTLCVACMEQHGAPKRAPAPVSDTGRGRYITRESKV